MTKEEIELKLSKYLDKFTNPAYSLGDWIVVDDLLYKKLKNKLNIVSIISNNLFANECVIVIETKKEYYAIKYSGRFVCVRRSETEYGLVSGEYEILVVNKVLTEDEDSNIMPFKDLCKLLDWKLGKKAREYLDYFR
jgi:hypothetical protein